MTVCVAAICQFEGSQVVIGASDRMLTVGDIEFEPLQLKVFQVTRNAALMMSGKSASMLTVAQRAWAELAKIPESDMETVSQTVANKFQEVRRQEGESVILAPLGLDLPAFLLRQRELGHDLADDLRHQLLGYQLRSSLIVAGTDPSGAHIYVVTDPGVAVCNDIVGFAAIGYGRRHAESQFMFAQYMHNWQFEKALRLLYLAKKRAEVAPGVGAETDLFYIGPHPGPYGPIGRPIVAKLEEIYKEHVNYMQVIGDVTDQMVIDYVKELKTQAEAAAKTSTEQTAKGISGRPPEPGGLSSNAGEGQPPTAPERT